MGDKFFNFGLDSTVHQVMLCEACRNLTEYIIKASYFGFTSVSYGHISALSTFQAMPIVPKNKKEGQQNSDYIMLFERAEKDHGNNLRSLLDLLSPQG